MHDRFDQLMYAAHAAGEQKLKGHSHNDYAQKIPFFTAYYAGMESIEIDLFLQNDSLYAAHEKSEVRAGRTLEALYLRPLAALYKANKYQPFADSSKNLQLLIDLKEDYRQLMPALITLLQPYRFMFDPQINKHAVRIVISGNMPSPENFDDYPAWIYFDGRPSITYSTQQRARLGLISEDLRAFTNWNGKGVPTKTEMANIQHLAKRIQDWGLTLRLWGTPESVNTWIILEKLGVFWLNTDQPEHLKTYLDEIARTSFRATNFYEVYQPTYASDGKNRKPKNVLLLIGDGMGLGHIQAASTANGGKLNMTNMRHLGFSNTASFSPGNTDSGAGGSAIATGVKTFNGALSVDTTGRAQANIPDLLSKKGIHSGILSTGDASDATPAVFYAHHRDRNASEEISFSLAKNNTIDILIGALPAVFTDSVKYRQLKDSLANNRFTVLASKAAFLSSSEEKLVVYLPDSLMRPVKDGRDDLLSDFLVASIAKLKDRGRGFFIMAEGAQIDYGGHARDLTYVTTETLDFDRAVGEALRFADRNGETLVIVVADHETGGLSLLDAEPARGAIRANFSSNDHSSAMVPLMAYGPGAQNFTGYFENTEIFKRIMQLFDQE